MTSYDQAGYAIFCEASVMCSFGKLGLGGQTCDGELDGATCCQQYERMKMGQ